jgi:hypothetical protein
MPRECDDPVTRRQQYGAERIDGGQHTRSASCSAFSASETFRVCRA